MFFVILLLNDNRDYSFILHPVSFETQRSGVIGFGGDISGADVSTNMSLHAQD